MTVRKIFIALVILLVAVTFTASGAMAQCSSKKKGATGCKDEIQACAKKKIKKKCKKKKGKAKRKCKAKQKKKCKKQVTKNCNSGKTPCGSPSPAFLDPILP